jgi:4'-phosphopantetheinyl transferase
MPPLAADEVRIRFRFTESMRDDEIRILDEVLSSGERERRRRFAFPHDRRDFAAAHALLRRTLSLYGGLTPSEWRFDSNPYGKPAIAADQSNTLAFNLSHTRGLVACAVATSTDVGLDVEGIRDTPAPREIAARYFSDAEIRQLDACPPADYAQRFIEIWTLKESYIKAIGTGLHHPLDSFSFTFDRNGVIHFDSSTGERQGWQFALAVPAPLYRLAIAVRCDAQGQCYRITLQDDSSGAETELHA